MGLAGQPGIPPTAAPPETSYRRPEDIIVLSRSPRIPCTTSHGTHRQTLQQKAPLTGCLLGKIHGFGQTTRHTPHSRTSATPSPQRMKILTRKYLLGRVAHERRGQYCFISPTQDTMHYFTQNTPPNPTTKGTPYRVPSGQDPWVWPDNPAYPPQPHLRYPLTSKDEDPNKKILARQSCSRAQRTLLFYLLYNNTTQKTDITS